MHRLSAARALRAAALLLAVPAAAHADPVWISPIGAPPDAPAHVEYLAQESSADRSVFVVTLQGIWIEEQLLDQGVFHDVRIPGQRGERRRIGRPAVPIVPLELMVPADGQGVVLSEHEVLAATTIPDVRVIPAQPSPIEEPNGGGVIPPFEVDWNFYQGGNGLYPVNAARIASSPTSMHGVPVHSVRLRPVRVLRGQDALRVDWSSKFTLDHAGPIAAPVALSRRAAYRLADLLDNVEIGTWPSGWDLELDRFDANYLIVSEQRYLDAMQPFRQLKREQGYRVKHVVTETVGSTADDVKAAIADWYDDVPPGEDAYVLLVGDVDQIPLHVDPEFGRASDHWYACLEADGSDPYQLHPEVGLGRLSVDDEQDCATQVAKIVDYQVSPPPVAWFYRDLELAAHPEEGRDYVRICEDIAAWYRAYTDFTVTERYGDRSDGLVANALADYDAGRNLGIYRGHGSSTRWASWDFNGDSLYSSDVETLANGSRAGFVMSTACTNNGLDLQDDCFGETWLEHPDGGAVAHYGATRTSYTWPNHELAYWYALQLQNDAEFTLSEAAHVACATMCFEFEWGEGARTNWWSYLLLGDPSMRLWKSAPYPFVLAGPDVIDLGALGVGLQVLRLDGSPVAGATVSLVQGETLLGTAYSAADGTVSIPVADLAAGEIVARVTSDFEDTTGDRIVIAVTADEPCPADLDADGDVGFGDLLILLGDWGGAAADVDGDGEVGFGDLLVVLGAWGACP